MSLVVTSSQKHYARFGRCENVKTGATRCAMTKDDCEPARNEDGERWYNDLRLKQKGIDDGPCKCGNTLMGACVTFGAKQMNFECAPRTINVEEDYCVGDENGDGTSTDPTYAILPTNSAGTNCYCDALQSIEDDRIHRSSSSRTKYGACHNQDDGSFFCAYSSEYCEGNHRWVRPELVPDIRGDGGYCTCEQTHIGGCIGGMESFHCALSEDDCYWNEFVMPIPLKAQHNHACMLCEQTVSLDPKPDEIETLEYSPSTTSLSFTAGISIGITVSVVSIVLCGMVRFYVRKDKTKSGDGGGGGDDGNDATKDSETDGVPEIS